MGRWFATLLLVIVAAVAAVLIVPSFIDWNAYRAPIEREASRLAERQVKITGDIKLRMLPSPGFIFNDLTIADPKSPTTPLLSAARLEASAAWLPLFLGRIEIARLGLREPIIRIRINADGSTNWSVRDPRLARAEARPLPAAKRSPANDIGLSPRGLAAAAAAAIFPPSRLTFRQIWIERGTLLFSDVRNGASDRADKITGRFDLARPKAALAGQVAFIVDGQSLRIALNVSRVVRGQPTPAAMTLSFVNGGGTLTVRGTASGLSKAIERRNAAPFTFLGRLDLQSPSSAPVGRGLLALVQFDTPPERKQAYAPWRRVRSLPMTLSGTLDLSKDTLALSNARGSLGKTRANIAVARARAEPQFDISIAAEVIYLDELVDFTSQDEMRFAPIGAASGPMQSLGGCRCDGTVRLTAPRVVVASANLSDLDVDVQLNEAGAELRRAHIVLPGDSDVSGAGRLLPPGDASGTVFDGTLGFKSENPRALLQWLDVPTDRIAPNSLRRLAVDGPIKLIDAAASASSGLRGTKAEHYVIPVLAGVNVTLDDQTLLLSASYDDRTPRRLMFHLEGEWLDADAYGLNALWLPSAPFESRGWNRTLWGRAARSGDVDLTVKLGSMRLAGRSINGFAASVARTADGPADGHLQIADVSGYKLLFDGKRERQAGDAPPDIAARLTVSGAGKPITLPLAGKGLPGSLRLDLSLEQKTGTATYLLGGRIGDIKLKGLGTGAASANTLPDIESLNLTAEMAQGEVVLTGALRGLTIGPSLAASLTIDAMDFPAFMRELGYSYEPRRKDLGALTLVSEFVATGERIDVASLAASVGQDSLNGSGSLTLGERAKLIADLKIGRASLDGYLPAADKASFWSTERLKVDVLRRFDGAIHLAADRFEIGPYDLRKLEAGISVQDSTVSTEGAKAALYGGAFAFGGSAKVTDDGIDGSLRGALSGFDWTKGAAKLFPALGTSGTGRADARFAVTASGRSLFDLARSFGGTMDVSGSGGALEGFDMTAWSSGLRSVGDAEAFLRLVKSALGSGSTGVKSFRIDAKASKGTLALSNGHLVLDGGEGQLSGNIELPRRRLSVHLAVQPLDRDGIAPATLVASGPIAGPARYYDLRDIGASMATRLGIAGGQIRASDVPRDLRDLLRAPPAD